MSHTTANVLSRETADSYSPCDACGVNAKIGSHGMFGCSCLTSHSFHGNCIHAPISDQDLGGERTRLFLFHMFGSHIVTFDVMIDMSLNVFAPEQKRSPLHPFYGGMFNILCHGYL